MLIPPLAVAGIAALMTYLLKDVAIVGIALVAGLRPIKLLLVPPYKTEPPIVMSFPQTVIVVFGADVLVLSPVKA